MEIAARAYLRNGDEDMARDVALDAAMRMLKRPWDPGRSSIETYANRLVFWSALQRKKEEWKVYSREIPYEVANHEQEGYYAANPPELPWDSCLSDLTSAEIALAEALFMGWSVTEIARMAGIDRKRVVRMKKSVMERFER